MTMLLPRFELHQPKSIDEALSLAKKHEGDFDYLAGGTDLLPNYKCGLNTRSHVISLAHVPELKRVSALEIGACAPLTELERNREVPTVVATAAGRIASPLLRESGTLGGNLMLDTRCHFFNQSWFWRRALGWCLKADGDRCHVVPRIQENGKSVLNNKVCVATHSSDLAPVLVALGATAHFAGPAGSRSLLLQDFYHGDGIARFEKQPGEILVKIALPEWAATARAGYEKVAQRRSIDFPVLGVAAAVELEGGKIAKLRVCLGAVDTVPLLFDFAGQDRTKTPPSSLLANPSEGIPALGGRPLDDACIAEASAFVQKVVQPKMNVPMDPAWRRKMAGVMTRRLLTSLCDIPS